MSLRYKLILLSGLLTIIGVATGSIAYFYISREIVHERVEDQIESVIVLKESQLAAFFRERTSEMEGILRHECLRNAYRRGMGEGEEEAASQEKNRETLKNESAGRNFLELFILDMAGRVYASTDPAQEGKIRSNEDYFIFGRERLFEQNFYYSLSLGGPTTVIALPIKDEEGKIIGVLAGRLDFKEISEIMDENAGLGETGETFLVNKFNYAVSGLRKIPAIKTVYSEGIKDCLRGQSGHKHYYDYAGDLVIGRYKWLPERKVCLMVEIDEDEAFASLGKAIIRIAWTAIFIVGLVMFLAVFIFRSATRSLRELRDATTKIGRGNLDAKVIVRSKDEVGQLAVSFKKMIDNLKEKTTSIDNLNREITERKQAEEKMETSEKKFRAIFDNASDGILLADLEDKKFFMGNKKIREMLGYTAEEIKNLGVMDIHPEKDLSHVIEEFSKQTKGEIETAKNLPVKRKDGGIFYADISASPVTLAGKTYMAGFFRDITERKRAEEALRAEKDKLQEYFNVAGILILIFDTGGKVLLVNKKGCDILGHGAGEIIGQNWFTKFVPPGKRAEGQEIFKNCVSQVACRVGYLESPVLIKGGQEKNIAWSYAALKDEKGQVQAILSTGIDITGLKRAENTIEELKKLDKLKDEFLNIAAHELKTPLTSIIGLSELLKKHRSGSYASQKEYTGIIYDEAMRLKKVVGQILTVTRYESGKITVVAEEFVLGDYIASLRPTLEMSAKRTKSKIVLALKIDGVSITGDKEKIAELIYNFVDNAVKYGPDGQTIAVSAKKEGQNLIRIAVADQGKGISEEDQKKIFNKFTQLEPSFSRTQEGTGLGLYICKLIIEKLGGKIGVESKLGKGSTFYFTVPVNNGQVK